MPKIAWITLLALAASGCGGCKRSAEASAADASADAQAAAPQPLGPWRAQVAARMLGSATLTRLSDGTLALSSGLFVHTAANDGSISTLGAPSAYAAIVADSDEDIGGYEGIERKVLRLSGSSARLFAESTTSAQTFLWDGRAWTKTSETPSPQTPKLLEFQPQLEDRTPVPSILPKTHHWSAHAELADGRRAWLGTKDSGEDEVFIVDKDGKGVPTTALLTPKDVDPSRCGFLESADEHLYAHCIAYRDDSSPVDRLSRLDDVTWVEMPVPRIEGATLHPMAVDSTGGVWLIGAAPSPNVYRAGRDGSLETITLPEQVAPSAKPFYNVFDDTVATRGGDDNPYRRWAVVTIETTASSGTPPTVTEIVPRRAGDVWIVAQVPEEFVPIYRIARDQRDMKEQPTLLGRSITDEHNEVLNTRPTRPWIGHCAQIFVTLASAAKGEILPVARVTDRMADIEAAIAKMKKTKMPRAHASVVTGRLGDREVAGVAFVRTYPEASEADMEAAATRLIERFTIDPASPPPATCTLPVLEQLLRGDNN